MTRAALFVLVVLVMLAAGCGGTPLDDYEDKLVLGTKLVDGGVSGITTSFTIPSGSNTVLIHWAIESKYDIGGGRELAMLIEQKTGGTFVERRFITYPEIQEADIYYIIDSFSHSFGTGAFRATVISGIRKVASREYTVRFE